MTQKVAIVKDYAAKYQSLSADEAQNLIKRWSDTDVAAVQLRMKFIPKFQDALRNKKAARFFQIDRRIGLIADLQLASQIPLVEQ